MSFEVFECTSASCRFRFPVAPDEQSRARHCPVCGEPCLASGTYQQQDAGPDDMLAGSGKTIALLDNVRSAYNVGAIFRTADGAGIGHLHLCGITPTPEHERVAKTGLGAEESVAWSYHLNAPMLAETLRRQGYYLLALEGGEATPISRLLPPTATDYPMGIALIVGNERCGVAPALLALSDQRICIPMQGAKRSLNVAVAFGIAAYWLKMRS